MDITYTEEKDGKGQFRISVTEKDLAPHTTTVIADYQQQLDVPGFRKGKIPEAVIRQRIGDVKLLEEALERMLPQVIDESCAKHGVDIYGQPDIRVEKIVSGAPIELTVGFTKLPRVTLTSFTGFAIEKKNPKVAEEDVTKTLTQLQRMYAEEKPAARKAQKGDKVMVDFNAFLDNIPVEGGSAKQHPVVIGENTFVPGFEENLIGVGANEEKTFTLSFPKDYRNKNLANRDVEFKAKVHSVFEIIQPELNDEFAKRAGATSLTDLQEKLKKNLQDEAQAREDQRQELALMQELMKKNAIDDIPQAMIDDEASRMTDELAHSVERDGGKFDDYLQSIKKTRDDLKKDFHDRAIERIKSALILRTIAEKEKLYATPEQIDAAIAHEKEHHAQDPQTLQQIATPAYRRHVSHALTTENVLQFLKKSNSLA